MTFETMLKTLNDTDRKAFINVADACYAAKLWFEDNEVEYTAADLLKFAQLVQLECEEPLNDC